MISLAQFIQKKLYDLEEPYLNRAANLHFKGSSLSASEQKRAKAEYKKTAECRAEARAMISNHGSRMYRRYSAPNAKEDPKVLEEYRKFCAEEEEREARSLAKQRRDAFLQYVVSREDLLVRKARTWAAEQAERFRTQLRTGVVFLSEQDYEILGEDWNRDCSDPWMRDWDDEEKDFDWDWRADHMYVPDELNPNQFTPHTYDLIVSAWQGYVSRELVLRDFLEETLTAEDPEGFQTAWAQVMEGIDDRHSIAVRNTVWEVFGHSTVARYLPWVENSLTFDLISAVPYPEGMALLLENPCYGENLRRHLEKVEAENRRRQRIIDNIHQRIPENPVDLFPEARNLHRRFLLHIGPTNSGKTHDALEALARAESGVYLGPLRLLAFEAYEQLNAMGVPCSLVTGEEEYYTEGARHTASTVEILNPTVQYRTAVIDEAQMLADPDRGWAWTHAILGVAAEEVHVCAAPEAEHLLIRMITECGDDFQVIPHQRMVPLLEDTKPFLFPRSIRKNDALVVFSKKKVLACAGELQRSGHKCSVVYGALPYDVRQREVARFVRHETDVLVATDAIGMGLNLPIERIVFLENQKFDGTQARTLHTEELLQIAGRAGRQGIYDTGYYTFAFDAGQMRKIMEGKRHNVSSAQLGFPTYLLGIEEPLSDIMVQWIGMDAQAPFRKASLAREYALCRELERQTEDKDLIYSFITIPFDEGDRDLKDLWRKMFRAELSGAHLPFTPPRYANKNLGSMELAYKLCDLMYFYLRRFTDGAQLEEVLEYKGRISGHISDYLKDSSLPLRKCSVCGKPMPWNHPYGVCNQCWNSRRRRRYLDFKDFC